MIINVGKEKEGVVPQNNHIVDQSISPQRKLVRSCDNRISGNDNPTSCSTGMIGIMNLCLLVCWNKEEEGRRTSIMESLPTIDSIIYYLLI
mmetsp:Transcript_42419/g.43188  ORF Transcript_42419/g.43188 Transcript_42419/m.43188 type:complete len:91 (-) Transcript_42419:65-337(-)